MGERTLGAGAGGVDTVLHTSVATFYNNLVTRPTGRAVRVAIERQIEDTGRPCLSILDFSQVGVLDFSCADEVIAKLLQRYERRDRPTEAFFVLRGASEHRELIEAVLGRHNLLLVAIEESGPGLWGPAPSRLRKAWNSLSKLRRALSEDFASAGDLSRETATSWLQRLVSRRVAIPQADEGYSSLEAVLDAGQWRSAPAPALAAERHAEYGVVPEPAARP